jgi:hypothetical protein
MVSSTFETLAAGYHWQLSLYAAIGIALATFIGKRIVLLVPAFREAYRLNEDTAQVKMQKPNYAANQKWNRKWGLAYWLAIFGLILPFCLTLEAQPWWRLLLDVFVILMVYDFFYYLVHRFIFHDGGSTPSTIVSTIPAGRIPAISIRWKWRWVSGSTWRQSSCCRGSWVPFT